MFENRIPHVQDGDCAARSAVEIVVPGADVLVGGGGSNTLSYVGSPSGVTINLATSTASGGDATGDTFSGFENVAGSAYADTLTGDVGWNRIDGGAGADIVNGAAGMDTLIGGSGNDTFVFNQPLGPTNIDAITDFTVGSDLISLSKSIYSALQGGATPGSLSPSSFHYSTALSTSGGLGEIIYNAATGSLLYDADGVGAGAAQQFATLSSGLALSAASFKLA